MREFNPASVSMLLYFIPTQNREKYKFPSGLPQHQKTPFVLDPNAGTRSPLPFDHRSRKKKVRLENIISVRFFNLKISVPLKMKIGWSVDGCNARI